MPDADIGVRYAPGTAGREYFLSRGLDRVMNKLLDFGNDPRLERVLLGLFAASAFGLAGLELFSPVGAALREGSPIAGRIMLRNSAADASVPAQYLFIFSPARRSLDVVYLSKASVLDGVPSAKVQWTLSWPMPARFGSPTAAQNVGAWIKSRPRGLRFWLRAPRWIGAARRQLGSTLSLYDGWRLCLEFARLEPDCLRLRWISDSPQSRGFLNELLGLSVSPRTDAPATVEIWNASGRPGVALEATKVLRLKGIDVLDFGNAPTPAERTEFLDRAGSMDIGNQVRRALGCGQADVITRMDSDRPAAVTAVLGRDFRQCAALAAQK